MKFRSVVMSAVELGAEAEGSLGMLKKLESCESIGRIKTPLPWWWFQRFFIFTWILGRNEAILTNMFQMGWFNHQLVI